ncbi:MAG: DNA translocase FtsK [Clostridia bacterium]|nr:DNA translocase FtsK [Clostridia bacterium]
MASKQTSTKKKSTQTKSNSTKKTNTKSGTKRTSTAKKNSPSKSTPTRDRKSAERDNQILALILFASAALLTGVILVPGENLWRHIHNFFMGVFGGWAILISLMLAYVAFAMAKEKSGSIKGRFILSFSIIMLICTTVYVFSGVQYPANITSWAEMMAFLYSNGISNGGASLAGGIIGIPIIAACGELASKILIVVLLVLFIMVLTGITLVQVMEAVKKPVNAVRDGASRVKSRYEESQRILRENPRPVSAELHAPRKPEKNDIVTTASPYGNIFEEPQEPVSKPLFENKPEKAEKKKKGTKAEREILQDNFNIDESNRITEPDYYGSIPTGFSDEALKNIPVIDSTVTASSERTEEPFMPFDSDAEIIEENKIEEINHIEPSVSKTESAEELITDFSSLFATESSETEENDNNDEVAPDNINEDEFPFTEDADFSDNTEAFSEESVWEKTEETTQEPFAPSSSTVVPVDISESQENAAQAAKEYMEEKAKKDSETLASNADMALYNLKKDEPKTYVYPPASLLKASNAADAQKETEELQNKGATLIDTLASFGVKAKIIGISRGPSVTRYEIQPAPGVKISKITNLADDLALNLAATGVRIEAPIPGKAAVGIEVPNSNKSVVCMRELVESNPFVTSKSKLTVALGRDIGGQIKTTDLAKMPHLLIAGTTGSGKSVCINSLIISLLYKSSPDDVRFLMIDPKVVELGIYNGIPHLLVPVVTDPRKAAGALNWAVTEMLNRYKTFAEFNVRDINGYNSLAKMNNYEDDFGQPMLKMPQIVVIIDELADLMMAAPKEVEDSICRLAQMARAAGMHLVVATQRPTVDVVTGLIKANIPSRIAFAVSSAIDSRTILDTQGAEKLLGQGDMLFSPVGSAKPTRIQGCFVSDGEIEQVISFIKSARSIEYDEDIQQAIDRNAVMEPQKGAGNGGDSDDSGSDDPILEKAIELVIDAGQASTSLLQRRLSLGYARAGRYIDTLESLGVIGPYEGSKPRKVLMTKAQWLERSSKSSDPDRTAMNDET